MENQNSNHQSQDKSKGNPIWLLVIMAVLVVVIMAVELSGIKK